MKFARNYVVRRSGLLWSAQKLDWPDKLAVAISAVLWTFSLFASVFTVFTAANNFLVSLIVGVSIYLIYCYTVWLVLRYHMNWPRRAAEKSLQEAKEMMVVGAALPVVIYYCYKCPANRGPAQ
jgi:predicted membrane metal-binding protein